MLRLKVILFLDMKTEYKVTGMSCAACKAAVEKAVMRVDGVTECNANFMTGYMSVEGGAPAKIINAVKKAGYGADVKGSDYTDMLADKTTKRLLYRFIISLVLLLFMTYVSMGYAMFSFPVPYFINNTLGIGIYEIVFCLAIIVVNKNYFINGLKGVIRLAPNMDTLVSLGSSVSFAYSVYAFADNLLNNGDNHYYFESAAMILVFIDIGKMLESYSKGKTTTALKSLIRLFPKKAIIVKNKNEVEVNLDEVAVGDIIVVKSGFSIPVDGEIIQGTLSIDESSFSGESLPLEKSYGEKVFAGTTALQGNAKIKATEVGSETQLSKIVNLVNKVANSKAPIAKTADKIASVFVPLVLLVSLITFVIWFVIGRDIVSSLTYAVNVLVISCPCSLGLATPVAIMVATGIGAKNGIYFKNTEAIEISAKVSEVAFDKTGTITEGKPAVTECILLGDNSDFIYSLLYSLEKYSNHPLASSVCDFLKDKVDAPLELTNVKNNVGFGIEADCNDIPVRCGSYSFVSRFCSIGDEIKEKVSGAENEGQTSVFLSVGNDIRAIVLLRDKPRNEAQLAVSELNGVGINTCMLTGDNKGCAAYVSRWCGIERFYSKLTPVDKDRVISELCSGHYCAMVGDGINDALALTRADVGIAVGRGTDVAIDSADIVLIGDKITDVPAALRLSRKALTVIKENLFWAFFYNLIGIPIAAGVLSFAGVSMSPEICALCMSLSSVCVVSNALRLNLFNVYSAKRDRKVKIKEKKKEKDNFVMTKTFKVDGMMCPHCEMRVKKVLEEIDGVSECTASHTKGEVEITYNKPVDDEIVKNKIESEGYTVV